MIGVLYAMIIGCLICIALMAFAKPLRSLLRFVVSAAIGSAALWACHGIGIGIGVNWFTAATVGALGAPGFFGLLALSVFL